MPMKAEPLPDISSGTYRSATRTGLVRAVTVEVLAFPYQPSQPKCPLTSLERGSCWMIPHIGSTFRKVEQMRTRSLLLALAIVIGLAIPAMAQQASTPQRYAVFFKYSDQAIKGLVDNPQDRTARYH